MKTRNNPKFTTDSMPSSGKLLFHGQEWNQARSWTCCESLSPTTSSCQTRVTKKNIVCDRELIEWNQWYFKFQKEFQSCWIIIKKLLKNTFLNCFKLVLKQNVKRFCIKLSFVIITSLNQSVQAGARKGEDSVKTKARLSAEKGHFGASGRP